MKTFLVVNPRSANGQTGRRWAELDAAISKALPDYGHAFTERTMHATELTRRALHDGYECVVAVGGDGTVNEVVNGFFENDRPINPNAAMGLVARGTGGDFRRTFNWDNDLEASLARLKSEATQPFDVGVIDYEDARGKPGRRFFANICSFGVSGMVVKKVNESSKALGGKLSFMVGSLKALAAYSDREVQFQLDDEPPREMKVTAMAVANGRYFGGGMLVAPGADVNDGIFDVTVWTNYGLSDFIFKQGGLYSGEHINWDRTHSFKCKKLVAKCAQEMLIDCDGEQPGRLPVTITMRPSAIRLKI